MAHVVSRKLSNSFEGALAGGGDPATSPLYVFGPFFKLLVAAGVAHIVYGASIWLVLLTVAVVSAMYRLVMHWVTDGSGGSGLTEEEFGGWAVKINAGITFVEYTLTFLVSVAALVTFIADRFPVLNYPLLLGLPGRVFVAIFLSVVTGYLVNLGPKVAARVFGPATLAVLLLLWAMNFATIWKLGLELPPFNLQAFVPPYLNFTLGGYARILALMTGIEVFANLVAAYEGSPEEKARKAFGSLLIIMGSTTATMLITGPAIYKVADPMNEHVSVFTQTMDFLLPDPLPYIGTIVGVIVLLSASAASAQGIQNLALGLKDRHYIPPVLGQRNKYEVADKPVWLEVGIVSLAFLAFGTSEETYLAIYAAGVFILLSMTAWAASKRLVRELRQQYDLGHALTLVGSVLAAFLTSLATVLIFYERFTEGAWMYFVFIPFLYAFFTYFRNKLGDPSPLKERLGEIEEAMWGLGIPPGGEPVDLSQIVATAEGEWAPLPGPSERWRAHIARPQHILVPLDGSKYAERVLPVAVFVAQRFGARITLASVIPRMSLVRLMLRSPQRGLSSREERLHYLQEVARRVRFNGVAPEVVVDVGSVAETIDKIARDQGADLLVISTHGRSGVQRWLIGSIANAILQVSSFPVLLVPPMAEERAQAPQVRKILVPLDGSEFAERVLPYVRGTKGVFDAEIILLHVPEVPEAELYGAVADLIAELRAEAERRGRTYLEGVASVLREEGLNVRTLVTGSDPAATILEVAEKENVDVIMYTTHGRGGVERVLLGSVAERLSRHAQSLLFLLPIRERRNSR